MIKTNYTSEEWAAKEEYYIKELQNLSLPLQPDTKQVMELTSKLDTLYTEASVDFANFSKKMKAIDIDLKNAEAELFATIKQQQLTAGVKITENDVKGLVKTYIATHNLKGYKSDLYSLSKYYIMKTTFIEQVVKTISKKKEALVTDASMLKIENSLSGAKEPDR